MKMTIIAYFTVEVDIKHYPDCKTEEDVVVAQQKLFDSGENTIEDFLSPNREFRYRVVQALDL